jgi:hypothetical protein
MGRIIVGENRTNHSGTEFPRLDWSRAGKRE